MLDIKQYIELSARPFQPKTDLSRTKILLLDCGAKYSAFRSKWNDQGTTKDFQELGNHISSFLNDAQEMAFLNFPLNYLQYLFPRNLPWKELPVQAEPQYQMGPENLNLCYFEKGDIVFKKGQNASLDQVISNIDKIVIYDRGCRLKQTLIHNVYVMLKILKVNFLPIIYVSDLNDVELIAVEKAEVLYENERRIKRAHYIYSLNTRIMLQRVFNSIAINGPMKENHTEINREWVTMMSKKLSYYPHYILALRSLSKVKTLLNFDEGAQLKTIFREERAENHTIARSLIDSDILFQKRILAGEALDSSDLEKMKAEREDIRMPSRRGPYMSCEVYPKVKNTSFHNDFALDREYYLTLYPKQLQEISREKREEYIAWLENRKQTISNLVNSMNAVITEMRTRFGKVESDGNATYSYFNYGWFDSVDYQYRTRRGSSIAWRGTSDSSIYPSKDYAQLGSSKEMFDVLCEMGLVRFDDLGYIPYLLAPEDQDIKDFFRNKGILTITDLGEKVVEILPSGFFDPDLPLRIASLQGNAQKVPEVDRAMMKGLRALKRKVANLPSKFEYYSAPVISPVISEMYPLDQSDLQMKMLDAIIFKN